MCMICLQMDKFMDWDDALEMVRMARLEALVNDVPIIPEEHLEEIEDTAYTAKMLGL